MANDKIIIDLSKSMNARSFGETEIIHKSEFDRVVELINNKIIKPKEDSNNCIEIHKRYNDTITILGSRGSGKTSFLMSILQKYIGHDDIEIIELIDPTLIEEKGHIFLTLISLITDKVEKKISKNECDPCCKEYRKRKSWDDKLKRLAAGLPSIDIDNVSMYSNWHDPEHVMRKGLEAVKAAKDLEENFNKIVEEALEVLGKKAFLIAFDDIDVNFNNGWKVLETIRKYLTSPQVITLLSGDIKLFSKAIRKQQWINFGEELLKNEGERKKDIVKYDELVTEIESQYMQKIMKAPNRIHLLTIGEKLNNGQNILIKQSTKTNLEIKTKTGNNNPINISEYYSNKLKIFGLQNTYEVHTVKTYLLGLPLRTQIQMLKQFEDMGNSSFSILNITDAFVSDLYESGVDVELAKSQPKDFCNIAHDFLLKKELLNETYQLLPTSGSVNSNAVLFSLYTMFVEHSKSNPSMIFEYWITIATIKNLLTIMPYRSDQKKDVALVPTIEGVSDYSFIGQNKVYRDICSYLSTYIRASLNYNSTENKAPWGGTIILKGLAQKTKQSLQITQDRIDIVFKEASFTKRLLAFFPMSIASYAHKQQSIVIYSFYTLLGTITELLKRYNVLKEDSNNKVNDIYVLLKELSQVKDNVMPVFEKGANPSEQEPIFNTIEKENEENDTSLAEVLCTWMEKCPKCVPPHLIGKIATRAFYAMRTLDDRASSGEELNLGDAMHRRIVIVMNSALVEDAKENLNIFNLSNNNPLEKNTIFINNLKKVNKSSKEWVKMEFSRWLLACPLLLLYLNIEALQEEFKKKRDEGENNETKTENTDVLSFAMEIYKKTGKTKKFDIEWFKGKSIYKKLVEVTMFSK